MGISSSSKVIKTRKKYQIPDTVYNSILASYNIYAKRLGYNPEGWMEYFKKRTTSGRRVMVRKWIANNRQATIQLLTNIGEFYAFKEPEKKKKNWANYSEYLKSKEWEGIRTKIISEDKECLRCGIKTGLVVHHLRYKDDKGVSILGKETSRDLAVLCWDCHTELHNKYGRGASFGIDEIFKKGDEYAVILKSGRIIMIDEDAFSTFKKELGMGRNYIVFADAVFFIPEIEIIIREDTYKNSKKNKKEGHK